MSIGTAADDGYKKHANPLPNRRSNVLNFGSLLFAFALLPCLALIGLNWSSITEQLAQLSLSLPSVAQLRSIHDALPLPFSGMRSHERGDSSDSSPVYGDTQYVSVAQESSPRRGSKTIAVKGKQFPTLIDVTTEELVDGLESGLFTSVDLVKVRYYLRHCLTENSYAA